MQDTTKTTTSPPPTAGLWTRLKAASDEARFEAQEAARRGARAVFACPELVVVNLISALIVAVSRVAALGLVVSVVGSAVEDLSSLLEPLALIERAFAPLVVKVGLPLALAAVLLVGLIARAAADAMSWEGFAHAATHRRAPTGEVLWRGLEGRLAAALVWGIMRDLWLVALGALAVFGYASLLWMQVQVADGSTGQRAAALAVVALMYAGGLVWGGVTVAAWQLVPTVQALRGAGWIDAMHQTLGLIGDHLVSLYRLVGYAVLAMLPWAVLVWGAALLQLGAAENPQVLPALALVSAGAQLVFVLMAQVTLIGLRAAAAFWVAAIDGLWPEDKPRKTPLTRLIDALGLGAKAEQAAPPAPGIESLTPEATPNILALSAVLADLAPADTPEQHAATSDAPDDAHDDALLPQETAPEEAPPG
jgi:hypothetical protein